jgi:protein-S-isoprenylcysteine O-methyltransferase Ste14
MSAWRQARAVLLLPFAATVVVPLLVLWWTGEAKVSWASALGLVLIAVGLVFVAWTIRLFSTVGRGTLAPWDATAKLVVRGPYLHVRNPMISGVAFVLAGEAVALGSKALFVWFAAFALVNALYIPLVEEPGLRRRFGEDYEAYRTNVPRWLPRLRPWKPA